MPARYFLTSLEVTSLEVTSSEIIEGLDYPVYLYFIIRRLA